LLVYVCRPNPENTLSMQSTHQCRALQDRGASAGDEGDSGGSAWPPAILFSITIAYCTSLFSSLSYCIRLFWLSRILLSFAVVSSILLSCSFFFSLLLLSCNCFFYLLYYSFICCLFVVIVFCKSKIVNTTIVKKLSNTCCTSCIRKSISKI